MRIGDIPCAIGKGLAAGVAGTAAMTVSSTAKVLGVSPDGDQAKQRFSTAVHWGYGTGWGSVRGLLGAAGLGPVPATAAAAAGLAYAGLDR